MSSFQSTAVVGKNALNTTLFNSFVTNVKQLQSSTSKAAQISNCNRVKNGILALMEDGRRVSTQLQQNTHRAMEQLEQIHQQQKIAIQTQKRMTERLHELNRELAAKKNDEIRSTDADISSLNSDIGSLERRIEREETTRLDAKKRERASLRKDRDVMKDQIRQLSSGKANAARVVVQLKRKADAIDLEIIQMGQRMMLVKNVDLGFRAILGKYKLIRGDVDVVKELVDEDIGVLPEQIDTLLADLQAVRRLYQPLLVAA